MVNVNIPEPNFSIDKGSVTVFDRNFHINDVLILSHCHNARQNAVSLFTNRETALSSD